MKRLIVTLLFFTFPASLVAGSQWWDSGSGGDYFEEGPKWKEAEVVIPDYPKMGNLLEFQVDNPSSSHHYFLDSSSLSIADDYVIRYSVVIKTRSGATNVFYDGIRCETREYKNYAFGVNGAFTENEGAKWELIRSYDFFRKALIRGIVCRQDSGAYSVEQIIDRLKYDR